MKIKKILFLPAWYPNRTHLSVGSFVRSHAEALSKTSSVDVLYVCGDEEIKSLYNFEKLTVAGVDTYILYYRKSKSRALLAQLSKAFLYVVGQFYGYFLYRKHNNAPVLFHVHVLTRAAILPLVLSFFSKTSYFITEHWSRYLPQDNSYKGFFRKLITKAVVGRSKGVSAVSTNLKYHMNRHDLVHSNFKVISNVVAPVFLQTADDVMEENYLVHVSNFASCKNVQGILKAFKLLQETSVPFKLKMVGDGVDFENAKKQVFEEGLSNVTFTGFVYGQEVVNLIRGAKCLVLFSDYENQPVVIIESLCSGVPVIATTVGGIPEMIDQTNGVLVAPNDIVSLSEALRKLLTDETVFDKTKIRQKAVGQFSADIIANQFIAFYKDGGVECFSTSANP